MECVCIGLIYLYTIPELKHREGQAPNETGCLERGGGVDLVTGTNCDSAGSFRMFQSTVLAHTGRNSAKALATCNFLLRYFRLLLRTVGLSLVLPELQNLHAVPSYPTQETNE